MNCENISTVPPLALYYFYNTNAVISASANVFAFYMLFTNTPKEMSQYKYVLMNITFWAYFVDFVFGLLIGPVNLMPLFGGYAIGSLRWLLPSNGYWHILLVLIGTTGCATSIVFGFLYRWWILCYGHWVHEEPWRLPLLAIIPFLIFLPPIAYFQLHMWPTREDTALYIQKNCPNVIDVMQHDVVMVIDHTNDDMQNMMLVFNVAGVFNAFCITYSLVRIFRKLNEHRDVMSERTMRMNRQLTWSLILHTAIPGLAYIFPTLAAMTCVQLRVANVQSIMHFLAAVFFTHSTCSVLTMLVTIGAYRKKILQWTQMARGILTGRGHTNVQMVRQSITQPDSCIFQKV